MATRATSDPAGVRFNLLILLAFFFALRSCEYLKVERSEERRTLPLRRMDITFMRNKKVLAHSSPHLHLADTVSLYFHLQKRDSRGDIVTQCRTGHPVYCPVVVCANLVRAMLADPNGKKTDEVYRFTDSRNQRKQLTSKFCLNTLREFIGSIDDEWNIKPFQVGLHSMRSAAAMAMYLKNVPVYTIMLLGRWSSDAFLRYIRPQADNFSLGVSSKMISDMDFCHVPDAATRDDPRSHNSLAATANFGLGAGAPHNQNSFSVWN